MSARRFCVHAAMACAAQCFISAQVGRIWAAFVVVLDGTNAANKRPLFSASAALTLMLPGLTPLNPEPQMDGVVAGIITGPLWVRGAIQRAVIAEPLVVHTAHTLGVARSVASVDATWVTLRLPRLELSRAGVASRLEPTQVPFAKSASHVLAVATFN